MTVVRAFAAALALSLALVASPAPAADENSGTCVKQWPRASTCHFWFRGFPLLVSGEATTGGSDAWVRIWVTLADDTEGLAPLVECTARGTHTTCSNGFPDETSEPPWYGSANALPFTCHVEGHGSGEFRCKSGSGT